MSPLCLRSIYPTDLSSVFVCNLALVTLSVQIIQFMQISDNYSFASYKQPSCQEDEKWALWQFKESFVVDKFTSSYEGAYPKVLQWNKNASNCCLWDGIRCDKETGHVIGLDVSSRCHFGSINSNSTLFNLLHLKRLNLADNDFNYSQIPSAIRQFPGPIPSSLGKLTELTKLDLRENSLGGYVPSSLQNLTRLKHLGVDDIQKSDPILSWIGNLTQLVILFLHQNEFYGTTPQSLSKLMNLKFLSLVVDNLGHGMVKFDVFSKMRSLSMLDLKNIDTSFQFEKGNMNASFPKFKVLLMSSCNLIEFPDFLRNQSKLESLSLAGNMLRGPLPIPPPLIKEFDVSKNMLSGEILPHYCSLTSLDYLDLSGNNLSGNLALLDLSDNKLQGQLPRSLSNCKKFEGLVVSKNQLIDVFPSWLGALPYLRVMVLSHNGFYGAIGKVEKDLEFTKLQVMDLSFNNFVGELPSEYISSLNSMKDTDVASKIRSYMNFITSYNVTKDRGVYILIWYWVEVTLKGRETHTTIQNNFAFIDLSSNKFEGEIPELVGNLTALCSLNLSNNMLTGPITTSLGNLKELESLDLSNNNLSGKIPQQMNQLAFLAYLNVSHNNLIGPIPQGTQFNTFESSLFEGNLGLCGKPLLNQCENLQA
ncbi:receptor-like protein 48 [Ziziphus jujuba]|uniref:Receptor-like protein 48 n=1 Tax=Ziziphus jujuba TaxID=326968 RepID=A0ABM3ZWT9_ZIZJJ|nr:receptor-like protein 48 [Ziziphus jujuba]